MTQRNTITDFADQGLGTAALAEDVRNQYKPSHGNGNLPDDEHEAAHEVEAERRSVLATTGVDPEDMLVQQQHDELSELRRRLAETERALEGAVIENQMFRRFHGSVDDDDRKLFMQSVIFLAATAIDFKMTEDKLQEFFEGKGECLHPEESIKDTGFGVTVCTNCKKHVEPMTEAPCPHADTVTYGTVGSKQCLDCGVNLPRDHFTRVEADQVALADAVGVSIPKGQPRLNPGLAPRELPSVV